MLAPHSTLVETIQTGIQATAKELSDQGIDTLHVSERCVLAVPPPESK